MFLFGYFHQIIIAVNVFLIRNLKKYTCLEMSHFFKVFFVFKLCFQSFPHILKLFLGKTWLNLQRLGLLYLLQHLVQINHPLLFYLMQIPSSTRMRLSLLTVLQQGLRFQVLFIILLLYFLFFLLPYHILYPCHQLNYHPHPISKHRNLLFNLFTHIAQLNWHNKTRLLQLCVAHPLPTCFNIDSSPVHNTISINQRSFLITWPK